MGLLGVRGEQRIINDHILYYAVYHTPCLLIDAANCANPHKLYPLAREEQLYNIHVIEVELLYVFRDVLLRCHRFAQQRAVRHILLTTFNQLFHYQDAKENDNIHEHAWELLRTLGQRYDVRVGIHHRHEARARRFCDAIITQHSLAGY
ncbi:hypothetical protein GF342_00340 [Candidatus Woesearchaeota archaeon]|nr:hypothetical protein [Candidatus Woesearchaeota archaeon]